MYSLPHELFPAGGNVLVFSKHALQAKPKKKKKAFRVQESMCAVNTKVVRLRRSKQGIIQDCDVYIGRACFRGGWRLPQSLWYNPFTTKNCGSAASALEHYEE